MSNRDFHRDGWPLETVLESLETKRAGDVSWHDPRNLKASYFAGEDVVEVANRAFDL